MPFDVISFSFCISYLQLCMCCIHFFLLRILLICISMRLYMCVCVCVCVYVCHHTQPVSWCWCLPHTIVWHHFIIMTGRKARDKDLTCSVHLSNLYLFLGVTSVVFSLEEMNVVLTLWYQRAWKKNLGYKRLRQVQLISFQCGSSTRTGLQILESRFHLKVLWLMCIMLFQTGNVG